MHIPDGFLNNGVSIGLISVVIVAIAYSIKKVRSAFLEKVPVVKTRLATFPDPGGGTEVSFQNKLSELGQEKVWRMAAVGSLIFSAQMVNFPISGGTSGHLLGGVLASLILEPFEALIVMSAVLGVQAAAFGDGGIIALGANIFNMGVVGAIGGYYFFNFLLYRRVNNFPIQSHSARTNGSERVSMSINKFKNKKRGFMISVFVAAWLSVVMAAIATAIEIAFSGAESLSVVLPAMAEIHILIGIGEGIITVAILTLLLKKNFPLAVSEKIESKKYEE